MGLAIRAWQSSRDEYEPPAEDTRYWRHRADHPDVATRAKAIKHLVGSRAETDVEIVRRAVTDDPSGHVRAVAAEALGRIGDERHVPVLEEGLEDEYPPVADEAARALAQVGGDAAFDALAEAAKEGSGHRTAAIVATALPKFKHRAAEALLVELMKTTTSAHIRWRTIRALAEVGTRTCVPELKKLEGDPFAGTDFGSAPAKHEAPGVAPADIRAVVDAMLADAIQAASNRPPWPE